MTYISIGVKKKTTGPQTESLMLGPSSENQDLTPYFTEVPDPGECDLSPGSPEFPALR